MSIKQITLYIVLISIAAIATQCNDKTDADNLLPQKGICAHRGENQIHPENTLSAFKEAIRLGAHMIEFDVRMTKDKKLVIMHDKSVDRTTNGNGLVSELTFDEIRKLDAGSWKSEKFTDEKVPTLEETLEIMPSNIWLNVHLKGNAELGEASAKVIVKKKRINQAVIACNNEVLEGVRKVNPDILICNMERQSNRAEYVEETINGKFAFIQLLQKRKDETLADDLKKLNESKVLVNYFHAETAQEAEDLFNLGVNFILTNHLKQILNVADSLGIKSTSRN